MTVIYLIGIVGASLVLAWSTEKIIKNLNQLTAITGLSRFALTSILVALATSLPELIVSVMSAGKNLSNIAYGNVVGSNMVNLALVTGITAIWGKTIMFEHNLEIKKLIIPIIITFVPYLVILDGSISQKEGWMLVLIYVFYVLSLLRNTDNKEGKIDWSNKKIRKMLIKIIAAVGILLLSGNTVVNLAKIVAEQWQINPLFIGLFVVAIGTSLPELVFNLNAIKHHHKDMAIGNIIGSCVANVTLILGVSAIINPIKFEKISEAINPGIQYFFATALFLFFIRSKKKLERWEGLVLLFLFIYYTVIELLIV